VRIGCSVRAHWTQTAGGFVFENAARRASMERSTGMMRYMPRIDGMVGNTFIGRCAYPSSMLLRTPNSFWAYFSFVVPKIPGFLVFFSSFARYGPLSTRISHENLPFSRPFRFN
jgi:hypothetical protein